MAPNDPADAPSPDRAPVRLAQALPEVLDHLVRHRRTTTDRTSGTEADPGHPHPAATGSRNSRTHRRHRPSISPTPAR
ncbi:hypothetical protein [Nocardiopsis kunsanensis]|nr:hypothetical protein [Nocardiopsis kunsanensis]